MSLRDIFDPYELKARLWPAFLILLPVIVTIEAWVPAVSDFAGGIPAVRTACAVLAFLLAHIARYLGRQAQSRLFDKWGGIPTSRWMLRSDSNLDDMTKDRYRTYLEEHIDGWEAPSQADEETDREGAMATYGSAVRWLRDRTRDRQRFNLVFTENVSYGFRRNLYGLRWIGRTVASLCVVVNSGSLYYWAGVPGGPNSILGIATLGFSVAMTVVWFVAGKQQWVRDAADGYARALLAACDSGRLR